MGLAHSPKIITDDLIFYYDPLNPRSYPGSGTTVTDIGLGSTKRNGTLTSFVGYSNGAFSFNGTNTHIAISNLETSLSNNNIYSFCCWVKFYSTAQQQVWGQVDTNGFTGEPELFGLVLNTNGIASYTYRVDSLAFATLPVLNNWFHAGITKSGGSVRMYFNGILDATTDAAGSVNPTGTTHYIGRVETAERYFNGQISAPMFYNRALSAAEIQQNFNALRGRFGL